MKKENIIERPELVKLSKSLKKLNGKWAEMLAEKMYGAEPDFVVERYRMKVYNIINGVIIGQESRALFLEKGIELYNELNDKINSLKQEASKIAS